MSDVHDGPDDRSRVSMGLQTVSPSWRRKKPRRVFKRVSKNSSQASTASDNADAHMDGAGEYVVGSEMGMQEDSADYEEHHHDDAVVVPVPWYGHRYSSPATSSPLTPGRVDSAHTIASGMHGYSNVAHTGNVGSVVTPQRTDPGGSIQVRQHHGVHSSTLQPPSARSPSPAAQYTSPVRIGRQESRVYPQSKLRLVQVCYTVHLLSISERCAAHVSSRPVSELPYRCFNPLTLCHNIVYGPCV